MSSSFSLAADNFSFLQKHRKRGLAQYVLQKLPYVYVRKLKGILVVQYVNVVDTSTYNVYTNKMRCVLAYEPTELTQQCLFVIVAQNPP